MTSVEDGEIADGCPVHTSAELTKPTVDVGCARGLIQPLRLDDDRPDGVVDVEVGLAAPELVPDRLVCSASTSRDALLS